MMEIIVIGHEELNMSSLAQRNQGIQLIEVNHRNIRKFEELKEIPFVLTKVKHYELPDVKFYDEKYDNSPKNFGMKKLGKRTIKKLGV